MFQVHRSVATVLIATAAILSGCASELQRSSAPMDAARDAADTPNEITFTADVVARPPSDYPSTIRSGTAWRLAGRIAQGYVYRPVSTVFQVESRHVHEAYVVISGRALVGVYLPVEQAFVSVERVDSLPLK